MKKLNLSVSPLLAAIVLATGSSAVTAGTLEVTMQGHAVAQLTNIQNLPAPNPPTISDIPALYQMPRIAAQAGAGDGSGWATSIRVEIDDITGDVLDYTMISSQAAYFSAQGLQHDIRPSGRTYSPGPDFSCTVTNDANDVDGIYRCESLPAPTTAIGTVWAELEDTGYICGTFDPTASTTNGCARGWGAGAQVAVIGAPIATIPENARYTANWGGVGSFPTLAWQQGDPGQVFFCLDSTTFTPNGVPDQPTCEGGGDIWTFTAPGTPYNLQGANPVVFVSGDATQNANGLTLHNFQGSRSGGFFEITHTGTLAGGDFVATGGSYRHITDIAFDTADGIDVGKAQSFTDFSFARVNLQRSIATDSSKNVPAMGAFGLAALFGGLVAVAARLRRRVA